MVKTPQELAEILDRIRAQCLCAYSSKTNKPNKMCDCKFGATKIGEKSETGSGCPEMRQAIHLLRGMTKKEFEKMMERKPDVKPEESKISRAATEIHKLYFGKYGIWAIAHTSDDVVVYTEDKKNTKLRLPAMAQLACGVPIRIIKTGQPFIGAAPA